MKFIKYFFTSYLLAVLLICLSLVTYAQRPISKPPVKAQVVSKDTTIKTTDSLSLKTKSTNGLDEAAKYSADDSIKYDKKNNILYLYGNSRVMYNDFELDADYIELDQNKNTVFAKGRTNPKNNKYKGKPIFKQGTDKPITTDSLLFNYQTKKGNSFGVFTDVEQGFLNASQFKKNQYDEGFFKNGIYSTCNLPHPHFGIRITKGIVTDKQIITGPAFLEIEDVATPGFLPFGFFPKTSKRASGVMLPSFGEDGNLGFVMRDLGYYIGLNDYWDMVITASLYSKGSFRINDKLNYIKNYKYRGNFDLAFSSLKNGNGVEGTFSNKSVKDYAIMWSHSQDPAANPGSTLSASVNIRTRGAARNTRPVGIYDRNQLTQSSLTSNINYTKDLGLFNLSTSLRHSQDLATRSVSLTLPEFSLGMTRTVYPFDSKDNVGEKKWYQKIGVGYNAQGENSIITKDSLLFRKATFGQFQNGIKHSIPLTLSLNVLNYIQVSSGVSYNEIWHFQTIRKSVGPVPNGVAEVRDTISGFSRSYDYAVNSSLSTKFYGLKEFKGKIMAIRHVATPSVGFSYKPDFGSEKYGYYRDLRDNNNNPVLDSYGMPTRYSIYDGVLYGGPSPGRQAAITFGIDNNIEAKVRSSKDSVNNFVKVPILQGLSFNSSYNFAATSFKLQPINFSGRTAFFKEKLSINFGGALDPYKYNRILDRREDELSIGSGTIARLTNIQVSTSFSFNSEAIKKSRDKAAGDGNTLENATTQQKDALEQISRNPNSFVDFNVPWDISGSYSFSYSRPGLTTNISHSVTFRGDLSVTPKWKVGYDSGLDLRTFKLSYPQFNIYRDLHCWDLSFQWTPVGPSKSYFVNLRVKASILQDLKLSKRGSSYNSYDF